MSRKPQPQRVDDRGMTASGVSLSEPAKDFGPKFAEMK
jgi:hypothetical protein